jgi:hypothetical protein
MHHLIVEAHETSGFVAICGARIVRRLSFEAFDGRSVAWSAASGSWGVLGTKGEQHVQYLLLELAS